MGTSKGWGHLEEHLQFSNQKTRLIIYLFIYSFVHSFIHSLYISAVLSGVLSGKLSLGAHGGLGV